MYFLGDVGDERRDEDPNRIAAVVVVVVGVGAVVAFLLWLNHFLDGIGF